MHKAGDIHKRASRHRSSGLELMRVLNSCGLNLCRPELVPVSEVVGLEVVGLELMRVLHSCCSKRSAPLASYRQNGDGGFCRPPRIQLPVSMLQSLRPNTIIPPPFDCFWNQSL
jgi:hypothetical protein